MKKRRRKKENINPRRKMIEKLTVCKTINGVKMLLEGNFQERIRRRSFGRGR